MTLLIVSFLAGVLTVAAPCVLPLLPVIFGGAAIGSADNKASRQWLRPLIIAASLAVSVVVFSLLLKGTTALLGVPQTVWQVISGGIVLLLGMYYVWPTVWERLSTTAKVSAGSNKLLGKAYQRQGIVGPVLIGAALGPVFSSCSPTYALIVATILPASFLEGFAYLIMYALGMSITLLLIAFAGQAFTRHLRLLANPNGWFKKVVGILFILVGIAVLFGFDKDIQAFVLERGWYSPVSNIEESLR